MKILSRIIIKSLIVLISVFLIDGGRSFIIVGNGIQIFIAQDHPDDIEIPNQHHIISFNEEEKWLESVKIDFNCFNNKSQKFLLNFNVDSQDFYNLIWQPPKFV
jgi:hypothetical protein